MASGKQYKNVYTILEKVKKGEIQSHYKDKDGLFGKINFYKKKDLIKPYMHYIDEGKLDTIMDAGLNDSKAISSAYQRLVKMSVIQSMPDDQKAKVNMNEFAKKLQENYKKFPKHMIKDIHKLYYHQMNKLEFEDRTDENYTKFKMLERSNNPVAKIMTETSNLKSSIFARNLLQYYLLRTTMMEYIDPNTAQQFMQGMGGDGDPNDMDQCLDKMFNDRSAKSMLDEAIKEATDTCKAMDDAMDQETQERMFDQINQEGGKQAGNLSPDFLRKVVQELSNINFAMGSLKEKIKRLLDKSVSYFSAQTETTYEDLFNADNISGIQDYLELHPKLRKLMIEDIMIKEEKRVGKIDVYIDISGSMSSTCGTRDVNGNPVSKLDFAKAFVVKLKEMDMLNDVYVFNNTVKKYKTDPISIAMLDTCGGTDIEKAVYKIEQNETNALVITDAEDHCQRYSDKAFFIGVEGANFSGFRGSIEQYSSRGQVVVFDGSRIFQVDNNGRAVTN